MLASQKSAGKFDPIRFDPKAGRFYIWRDFEIGVGLFFDKPTIYIVLGYDDFPFAVGAEPAEQIGDPLFERVGRAFLVVGELFSADLAFVPGRGAKGRTVDYATVVAKINPTRINPINTISHARADRFGSRLGLDPAFEDRQKRVANHEIRFPIQIIGG